MRLLASKAARTVHSGLSHVARATTLGSSVTRGRSGLPGGLVPQPSCTSSACWCPESQVGQRLTTQTRVRHRAARSVHHCHCGRFYELLPGSPPVLSPVPGVMVLVTHSELRFAVTEPVLGRERRQLLAWRDTCPRQATSDTCAVVTMNFCQVAHPYYRLSRVSWCW